MLPLDAMCFLQAMSSVPQMKRIVWSVATPTLLIKVLFCRCRFSVHVLATAERRIPHAWSWGFEPPKGIFFLDIGLWGRFYCCLELVSLAFQTYRKTKRIFSLIMFILQLGRNLPFSTAPVFVPVQVGHRKWGTRNCCCRVYDGPSFVLLADRSISDSMELETNEILRNLLECSPL